MSLDSYLAKVVLMLFGSVSAMIGIAGGYYTLYRIVTAIGA